MKCLKETSEEGIIIRGYMRRGWKVLSGCCSKADRPGYVMLAAGGRESESKGGDLERDCTASIDDF